MRQLDLEREAVEDAASAIGVSLAPLLDSATITLDDAINYAASLAAAWLDGLFIVCQARRERR
jgi:hypothetical protein